MTKITSTANNEVKAVKKLGQKKFRQSERFFVVENFKIVLDAFAAGFTPEKLFFTAEFHRKNPAIKSIVDEVGECYEVNDKVNAAMSALDTPSGLLAVYRQLDEKFITGENCLYLNAVADPGNLGTLLRSAAAFGFDNIILDQACVDLYNPKTIHAAKDAIFKLNFSFSKQLNDLKTDYYIIAADMRGSAGPYKAPAAKPLCLILGSESHGVDPQLIAAADHVAAIATTGRVESLNVAVAGSILMEKIFSQIL